MGDTNERSVASDGFVADSPIGWAVVNESGVAVRFSQSFLTLTTFATEDDEIVPLYRSPSLTDAEREAVEWYANFPDGIHAATLRGLLERLET